MKGRVGLVIAGALVALCTLPQTLLAVKPCTGNCVQATVGDAAGKPGATVSIPVSFTQGPDDGQPGGIHQIAAVAMTLDIGPLTLADCTLDSDGVPAAVKPDASISAFKLVVENASCPANGHTHCLCPDPGSGITPDGFINLVLYGPNPLPTPGPGGIDIPVLPSAPPPFVVIDLKIGSVTSGTIPLHVYNEVSDTTHPQFTALLSVGDKLAVDQTCVPVPGQPPCSSSDNVSQVAIKDGTVTVMAVCIGDCNSSNSVSVDEVITMVNIALGSAEASACAAGDPDNDGIQITEIVAAVNNALHGCSQ